MWLTPTVDNLKPHLSAGEYEDIQEVAGHEELQIDGIFCAIVSLVRGKIAACDSNRGKMGKPGTLPMSLMYPAMVLVREALHGSLPNSILQTELRERETRQAYDTLSDVASCDFDVNDGESSSAHYSSSTADSQHGSYGGDCKLDF